SSSRSFSWWDTAGWLMLSSSAALVMLRCLATAARILSWCSVMGVRLLQEESGKRLAIPGFVDVLVRGAQRHAGLAELAAQSEHRVDGPGIELRLFLEALAPAEHHVPRLLRDFLARPLHVLAVDRDRLGAVRGVAKPVEGANVCA